MKRVLWLLLACALCAAGIGKGRADEAYRMTGKPHETLPEMTFTIVDTGRLNAQEEHVLHLSIQGGSYEQEMLYPSYETVGGLELARLDDVDFDGYLDLVLTHAQGASNFYVLFAPWLPEEGRFSEPVRDVRLCNYVLYPQQKVILSSEKDGAASYCHRAYGWAGGQLTLLGEGIMENDSRSDRMRERVVKHFGGGQMWVCWDDDYPVAWYDGSARVWDERSQVMQAVLVGHTENRRAVVDRVDWVNLRKQDTKASESVARLDAGTQVLILADGCGEDGGWIRVLAEQDGRSLTGYIWHSYLRRLD